MIHLAILMPVLSAIVLDSGLYYEHVDYLSENYVMLIGLCCNVLRKLYLKKTTCHSIRSRGHKTLFGQCQW